MIPMIPIISIIFSLSAFIIAISVIMLMLLAFTRSEKLMNSITILYSGIIAAAGAYALAKFSLPIYILSNNYFFIDTLSVYEIIVSGIIFFFAAIYARGYVNSLLLEGELNRKNLKLFYITFNLLLLSVVLAFSSNNLALLWVFAEITTILSAVLIVLLNAKENITAAIKYVFITSTAMLFSFIGLIVLFAASREGMAIPTLNWNLLLQNANTLSPQLLLFSFVFIFIGFGAKSGIVPFHNWLPPAHAKAPSDVSVLLSSAILNIGIYAIIRINAIATQTTISHFISVFLLVFGILTIGIAAFSMIARTNLKKLIAFSSIENMGIMILGIGTGSIFWVLYHTLAHALTKALLFFSAGILHRQYHGIKAEFIHSLFKLQPLAAIGLILGGIAAIGTPLFPMFISKFYILSSLGKASIILLFIVLLLLLIVAGAFAWFIIKIIHNKGKELEKYKTPLSMKFVVIVLIIILIILGIYFPEILRTTIEKIILEIYIP